MAKYIEVITGEYKGLYCYVRSEKETNEYFTTFDGISIKKTDCKIIEYEKHWRPEDDPGCRYRE